MRVCGAYFRFNPGEKVAGRSRWGGKTTLFRMVAGEELRSAHDRETQSTTVLGGCYAVAVSMSRNSLLEASQGWKAQTFYESEMALLFECMPQCARKALDAAHIVRDGDVSPITSRRQPTSIKSSFSTETPLPCRKSRSTTQIASLPLGWRLYTPDSMPHS